MAMPTPARPRPRPVKRRRLLKCGLGTVGVGVLGFGGAYGYLFNAAKIDTVDEVDFDTPLQVPPLAWPQTNDTGQLVYDLQLTTGERDFKPGGATKTWGINGDYLGPTIRARRGDQVRVNVRNSLGVESSLHWHGMHLPAGMDGGPHQPVADNDTWCPEWNINQAAATLWYHPHPHGETAQHVYRGLAGMFIVDDDEEAALDLPREYGVDDIPVIVQDRNFDGDNQLDESESILGDTGILGEDILVNGTYGPYLDVTTTRVRLRLLNASNARVYKFGFSDDRAFAVIGSDGGLLTAPHATRQLQLS
ncbi:MAG: multicopper oxidase family protein, partial [Stackebrandtia sp.]